MRIVRVRPWYRTEGHAAEPAGHSDWNPAADVWETPEAYRIDLDVPALKADAVEVTVADGVLTVAGARPQRELESSERVHRRERRAGRFQRRFRLPEAADSESVEARVADGVLELTIPKQAAERPRRIEVVAA